MKKNTFDGLNRIRRKHQMKVFNLLRTGDDTAAHLAQKLGLSKVSLYIILEELLQKNIITANAVKKVAVGRKPSLLSLNENYGYFAAVDFASGPIKIIIFNILGKIISEKYTEDKSYISMEDIQNTVDVLQEMLREHCIPRSELKQICICSPGRIDKKTGYFWIAAKFIDYTSINLEKIFSEAFGCNTTVKNDMHLALRGNGDYIAANGFDNVLYLYLGRAVGAGLFLNGKVHDGPTNAAGEFGSTVDFNGEPLPKQISLFGLVSQYVARTDGQKEMTEDAFVEKYKQEDALAVDIVNTATKKLAIAISNLISVLDIPVILIAGDLHKLGERFVNTLNEYLNNPFFYTPPRCILLDNGRAAMMHGCIDTAIEEGIHNALNDEIE